MAVPPRRPPPRALDYLGFLWILSGIRHLTEHLAPSYGQPVVSEGSEAAGAPGLRTSAHCCFKKGEELFPIDGLEIMKHLDWNAIAHVLIHEMRSVN